MADGRNVSMEIYGRLEDFAAVDELANQMVGYVSPDWNEGRFPDDESAISHIAEELADGDAIRFVRHETGEDLDCISEVCRKFGLSYRIKIDGTGHDSAASMITWTPGMFAPAYPEVDSDFQPTMTIASLRELLDEGIDALERQIESKAREALLDAEEAGVTASQAVADELLKFLPEDDAIRP